MTYTPRVSLPATYADLDNAVEAVAAEHQAVALVAAQRAQRWQLKHEKLVRAVNDYLDGKIGASGLREAARE